MEGVAHATYVTARMIHALDAMLGSDRLDAGEQTRALAQRDRGRACLRGGTGDARRPRTRLTPAGAAAFAALRRAMPDVG